MDGIETVRFTFFYLAIALFVIWRLILLLRANTRTKVWLSLLVLMAPLYSFAKVKFFGGLLSPELPRWVLMLGSGVCYFLLVLAVLVLCRDVLVFLCVLAGRSGEKGQLVLQTDKRVIFGMMAASGALTATGMKNGLAVAPVKRMDLPVAGLPDALDGVTVVQLSDLHASALLREPHMQALVDKVNALDADLIVITGDVADGFVKNRDKDVAPLAGLKAKYGVFVCEGNHEHYVDYDGWMKKLPTLNMTLLRNEHRVLTINGAELVIAGVTDPWARRFGRELPDAAKAFAGAPENAPRLLLAHQPKPAETYRAAARFDVQLSGHTHGGQIYGMDYAVAVLNHMYVRGWYPVKDALMYVHSGSGLWNGFPIRLGVPSEIALFTLRKASAAPDAIK